MKVEDLTDEDYKALERHFSLYGHQYPWLKGNAILKHDSFTYSFSAPFDQIPLLMVRGTVIEQAVYKFRLEKGV